MTIWPFVVALAIAGCGAPINGAVQAADANGDGKITFPELHALTKAASNGWGFARKCP